MPWIRTRPLGNDDVAIEERKRIWWTFWLFTTAVPVSTVRSSLNKVDWEIIELIDKLKAKLANRMALAEACQAEYDDAAKNKYDKFGLSEWIYLDEKLYKEKVKPYSERPKDDWRAFFSIPVLRQYKLNNNPSNKPTGPGRSGQNVIRGHIPGEPGGIVGVTLPEHAKHQYVLREGNVEVNTFTSDKNLDKNESSHGGGDQKKAQMRKLRQDNPFNSSEWANQKEWERHIQELWMQEFGNK